MDLDRTVDTHPRTVWYRPPWFITRPQEGVQRSRSTPQMRKGTGGIQPQRWSVIEPLPRWSSSGKSWPGDLSDSLVVNWSTLHHKRLDFNQGATFILATLATSRIFKASIQKISFQHGLDFQKLKYRGPSRLSTQKHLPLCSPIF